ncbi:MAG TPA: MFS transporter, partial [Ktedonobacteraceae bacterium]|nr:MFS transporter [Ktedonobacteraceae bacterium]
LGTLIFSLLEIFFAISRLYLLSLVLIAGVGVAETTFGALAVTALQTVAPDHLRGRVMSAYILFFTGSVPLGYVLAGWLSALCGVSTGLFLCDLLCLMIVGAGWMWRRAAEQNLAQATRL